MVIKEISEFIKDYSLSRKIRNNPIEVEDIESGISGVEMILGIFKSDDEYKGALVIHYHPSVEGIVTHISELIPVRKKLYDMLSKEYSIKDKGVLITEIFQLVRDLIYKHGHIEIEGQESVFKLGFREVDSYFNIDKDVKSVTLSVTYKFKATY